MDKNTVRRLGELLHGEHWVSGLARDLGVSRISVDAWSRDGDRKVPTDARRVAAIALVRRRIADLRTLLKTLNCNSRKS